MSESLLTPAYIPEGKDLRPTQEIAAQAVASGAALQKTAEMLGKSHHWIYRLNTDPTFRQRVYEIQQEFLLKAGITEKLHNVASLALGEMTLRLTTDAANVSFRDMISATALSVSTGTPVQNISVVAAVAVTNAKNTDLIVDELPTEKA